MADSIKGRPDLSYDNVTLKSPTSHKPNLQNLKWVDAKYAEEALSGNSTTFSFTDVHATLVLPFIVQGGSKCALPGLTLVSLSEHRDTYPVVGLGKKGIKGYTLGHKTTAGSLGFVLFGSNPFAEAIRKYDIWRGINEQSRFTGPDELPPLDLILVFSNDRNEQSTVLITSLKLLDRSQNISVRDIQLTEIYSFLAASCSYLIKEVSIEKPRLESGKRLLATKSAFMSAKAATTETTTTTTDTTTGTTTDTLTHTTTTTTTTTTTSTTTTTATTGTTNTTTAPV